jgi:hypothetical protein
MVSAARGPPKAAPSVLRESLMRSLGGHRRVLALLVAAAAAVTAPNAVYNRLHVVDGDMDHLASEAKVSRPDRHAQGLVLTSSANGSRLRDSQSGCCLSGRPFARGRPDDSWLGAQRRARRRGDGAHVVRLLDRVQSAVRAQVEPGALIRLGALLEDASAQGSRGARERRIRTSSSTTGIGTRLSPFIEGARDGLRGFGAHDPTDRKVSAIDFSLAY